MAWLTTTRDSCDARVRHGSTGPHRSEPRDVCTVDGRLASALLLEQLGGFLADHDLVKRV
eukprot:scaffold124245_cov29-Tisochrysis_lutea.AAC.2